jgi:protein TonB
MPSGAESKARSKMIWMLAAIPVLGLGVGGWLYFRSEHKAAPEPTAVKYDAPAVQPDSTSAADTNATPPAPVATAPITKPSAAAPAAQTSVPAAPQPRGVAPDAMNAQLTAPSRIGGDLKKPAPQEEAAPAGFAPGAMQSNAGLPGGVFGQRNNVQVRPSVEAISAGVADGMLIRKSPPIYPAIAKDAGVSGTVVIGATITKTGTLRGLHVVSGPPMLAGAALEAAKSWRYRPYLLDNEPVEVETTIRIVFNLDKR